MKERTDTDVLISGAGAAGLTLAIELARRGVSFRIIDQIAEPFGGSRGKGIQPRTLEIMDLIGVVDRIAAAGNPYPPFRSHREDGSFEDAPSLASAPPTDAEPYRTPLMLAQFRTEGMLRDRLAELGHRVAYGQKLESFVQDGDGVTVGIAGGGAVRCRYLVGCDGGRSFVRHALQIGFPGQTLGVRAIVADVALEGLGRDAWHRFNDGDFKRQFSLCPLGGTALFQLQAPIAPDDEPDLSAAGLQAFIDARAPGRGLVVRGASWASVYAMNARLADRYRVDRVFLAGDAAHIHPPTGGQGLNTSIQDAWNLGWKLAAALNGAPDAVLESYEAERRPIAASVLGLSTEMLARTRQGDMKRGREAHQMELGYAESPLTMETTREGPVLPGDRAPDAKLMGAGGRRLRLFDLLREPGWTLIACGDADGLSGGPGVRLHVLGGDLKDASGQMAETYGMADGDALLIRPDGYVAALAGRAERAALTAHMTRLGLR